MAKLEHTNLASEMVETLTTELQGRLGGRYEVLPQPALRGNYLRGSITPDFIVRDTDTGRIILVEVKGSSQSDELPLATIPVLRRLKESNKELDPEVVLVSASAVSPEIERSLARDNIRIISGQTAEGAVADLTDLIRDL